MSAVNWLLSTSKFLVSTEHNLGLFYVIRLKYFSDSAVLLTTLKLHPDCIEISYEPKVPRFIQSELAVVWTETVDVGMLR